MKSKIYRDMLILANLLSGCSIYFISNFENVELVNEYGKNRYFFHPYMQTLVMFIGEFLCLSIYVCLKDKKQFTERREKAVLEGKSTDFNILLLLLPTLCDYSSSMLNFFSLSFVSGYVWQISGGITVVFTLIFSRMLVKFYIKRNQISGCLLCSLGMAIISIGIFAFENVSFNIEIGYQILGYVMLILSCLLSGLFYAVEQKILDRYYIEPLQMVGFQGMFGIILTLLTICILTYVPCPFGEGACLYSWDGKLYFENPASFFNTLSENNLLMGLIVGSIFVFAFFNISGLQITKMIEATTRSMLSLIRAAIIWIVGLIVTSTVGRNNQKYQWEELRIEVLILQGIGFIVIIFGTLIYQERIYIRYLSAQKNQKEQDKQGMLLSEN